MFESWYVLHCGRNAVGIVRERIKLADFYKIKTGMAYPLPPACRMSLPFCEENLSGVRLLFLGHYASIIWQIRLNFSPFP